MSAFRPEVTAWARRWREVLAAAALGGLGVWIAAQGGWLLFPVGLALLALGFGWGLLGWRRLAFALPVEAAGLVEIDEGAVRYLHASLGGQIGLPDMVDLRLLTLRGRKVWRLRDAFGQALLIPVDAAGAEALFDAFASLPGLSSAALLAALGPGPGGLLPAPNAGDRLVWRRADRGADGGVAVHDLS